MVKRWPNLTPTGWTPWRLVVALLGALLVVAVAIGVSALSPQRDVMPATTPPALNVNAVQADATLTPTPRVIAIPQSTPAPTSSPTLAAVPTRLVEQNPVAVSTQIPPQLPTVTPTPWLLVADELATTPHPTIASSPTPLPLPTATLLPTPSPAPASPSPTMSPTNTSASPVQLAFEAADWAGGYYRGDGRAYGRPWTAIYGSGSDYPRAALTFALDAAPVGPATLTIVGLDDEWAAQNEIALEINGQTLFSGASPFANWDGVGNGANAAWTSVQFRLPEATFHAGMNDIAVANLTPASNFNAPPYVLLSEATLDLSSGGSAAQQPIAEPIDTGKKEKSRTPPGHQKAKKPKGNNGNGHGLKKGHQKNKHGR